MKLRGALLGGGNIALRGHAPQWTGPLADDVEIVALADLSPANRTAAEQVFPAARLYGKAEDLLASESLDFCDICTPPFTHRPLVEVAAGRGIHVLCEKPIATNLEDAEAIAQAVRSSGIVFVPCHQYHHSPQWQAVVRLLPRIGRVHLVEYEVLRTEANPGNPNWAPSWRTDPALAGGGILFDHGAHIFYQLRSVLGEPATVNATVRTLRHSDYGVEDSAFVMLDYGNRLAEVRLTWAARRRAIRFQFVGADGELVGDDERLIVRAATTEEVSFAEGMSRNSSHSEWYEPLMRDFVERVRGGDRSTGPLDEALFVARVIERAYESSRDGRPRAVGLAGPVAPRAARAVGDDRGGLARRRGAARAIPSSRGRSQTARRRTGVRSAWRARSCWLPPLRLGASTTSAGRLRARRRPAPARCGSPWPRIVNLAAVFAMAARWRALLRRSRRTSDPVDAFKAMLMGFAVSIVVPPAPASWRAPSGSAAATGLPRASDPGFDRARPPRQRGGDVPAASRRCRWCSTFPDGCIPRSGWRSSSSQRRRSAVFLLRPQGGAGSARRSPGARRRGVGGAHRRLPGARTSRPDRAARPARPRALAARIARSPGSSRSRSSSSPCAPSTSTSLSA